MQESSIGKITAINETISQCVRGIGTMNTRRPLGGEAEMVFSQLMNSINSQVKIMENACRELALELQDITKLETKQKDYKDTEKQEKIIEELQQQICKLQEENASLKEQIQKSTSEISNKSIVDNESTLFHQSSLRQRKYSDKQKLLETSTPNDQKNENRRTSWCPPCNII